MASIPLTDPTGAPWALSTRDGAVWVFRGQLLSRVDARTNKVVGTVRVGSWWDGVAWGDNMLWVTNGNKLYAVTLP